MKSLHLPRPSNTRSPAVLPPGHPVHTLVIARGHSVRLKTSSGCLWLTCDGAQEDCFLPASHQMTVHGPACLRLGAATLHAPAEVEWDICPSGPLWIAAIWQRLVRRSPAALNARP